MPALMFRRCVPIAGAVLAASFGPRVGAQAPPLLLKPMAAGVYWIQGEGANSGVVVGRTGVIVIDAGATVDAAKAVVAEIGAVTGKPITHVILTHGDPDHVNGLAAFPAGVTVIAHEGARRDLGAAVSPAASRFIARTGETTVLDGVKVGFLHWAPAHTNGDLAVHLPEHRIVFAGDLLAADVDPVVHPQKQGSSEGWITSVKGLMGLGAAQFVPGHGDLRTAAEVQARLTAAASKRDKILMLVRERKPLDEIRTAVGDPAPAPGTPGLSFTEVVYQELTRRLK